MQSSILCGILGTNQASSALLIGSLSMLDFRSATLTTTACPEAQKCLRRGDIQCILSLYSSELGIHQNMPMGCAHLQCCDLSSYRLDIHVEIANVGMPWALVPSKHCARGTGAKLRMTPPCCSQMTDALSDTSPNQVSGVTTPPSLFRATPTRAWRLCTRTKCSRAF